jgi:hypothetical protein
MRVCVIVNAEGQEHAVKVQHAIHDSKLSKSIISRAKAIATRGLIRATTPLTLTAHDGNTYSSKATVLLRWYYDTSPQTFSESF